MRGAKLRIQVQITKELNGKKARYAKQLIKCEKIIGDLRVKLAKQRQKEQYLKRCLAALNYRLGETAKGQLEFKL